MQGIKRLVGEVEKNYEINDIESFYKHAARSTGLEFNDDTRFDCTKIKVSEDLWMKIYEAVKKSLDGDKEATAYIILNYAPGQDTNLGKNEFCIEKGFLC